MSNLDDSGIFEDDSGVSLWALVKDGWDLVKCENEG